MAEKLQVIVHGLSEGAGEGRWDHGTTVFHAVLYLPKYNPGHLSFPLLGL